MSNNKLSAIDWLYREMLLCDVEQSMNLIDAVECIQRKMDAFDKAKEMEKQQIVFAWFDGNQCKDNDPLSKYKYYDNTYTRTN